MGCWRPAVPSSSSGWTRSQFIRVEDGRSKWPELASLIGIPLADLERICTTKTRSGASAQAAGAAAPSGGMVITLDSPDVGAPEAPVTPATTAETDAATKDETELDEPDRENNRPIRWANLCDQVPESVYEKVTKLGVRECTARRVYRRDYPHNEMAAHVVGYVDSQEHPIRGNGALRRFLSPRGKRVG